MQPDDRVRVLLIDDEPAFLALTKEYLEGDFAVTCATTAQEGLKLLAMSDFDVVVSDYRMPADDGIDLLKAIRGRGLTVLYILFTGRGREEVVIEALNNGADFYLQKGSDPESMYAELGHKIRLAAEKRRTDEALKESEEFLSSVFRSAPAGIGIVVDRRIRWVNPTMENMVGRPASDLIGQSARVLYPDDEEFEKVGHVKYDQLGKTGKGEIVTRFQTSDGRIIDVLLSSSIIHGMDMSRGVTFTALDITEQRKSAEAIRQSEEKFRNLFDKANDAMFLYYPNGRFVDVNRAACERFGYSKEEFLCMRPEDLDAPEEADLVAHSIKMIDDRGSFTFESTHMTKDGRRVPSEISARYVPISGRPAILAIARDITSRKSIEEGLKRANNKLNLLNQVTRHDIRNQLMVGKGHLLLLSRSCVDERSKISLDRLSAALSNIERQIDFTKNYQDLGTLLPAWRNMKHAIASPQWVPAIPDIQVGAGIDGLEVFADPMIEKVFHNLFENTVRYGGRPAAVRIDATRGDSGLMLSYEDVGPGVPDEEKELIFQRGFGKGTGLGLFLAREILALTGMTIKETGIPGKGARFVIHIPEWKYRYV